jgi:hypothetical protein
MDRMLGLMARVAFLGLVLWGFILYLQYEWMMWK